LTADAIESHKNFFDMILNTTSSSADNDALLGMLRVGGSLVYVGLAGESQSFDPFSLVTGLKSLAGSNTGGIALTQQMLDFCGANNIASTVELLDVSEAKNLDAAYARVVGSDVKYRFVIDADGHARVERMSDSLLVMRRFSPKVIFLGSYPRADRAPIEHEDRYADQVFVDARAWLDGILGS
jgi:threonine dehydrogenase-like Zn-dependent dehydrogenase